MTTKLKGRKGNDGGREGSVFLQTHDLVCACVSPSARKDSDATEV